jgi:hypothetical protein
MPCIYNVTLPSAGNYHVVAKNVYLTLSKTKQTMKRIFLGITLVFISLCTAFAQDKVSTDAVQTATETSKQYFEGKVKELDVLLTKGNAGPAQQLYSELAGIMQRQITENQKQVRVVRDEDKSKISQLASQQTQIYAEAKTLSANMIENHKEFIGKLQAFTRTL